MLKMLSTGSQATIPLWQTLSSTDPKASKGGHLIGPVVPAICPMGKDVPQTHPLRENQLRTWFSNCMICEMVCGTAQIRESQTLQT